MRKYWKWITAILAFLLIGLLIWFIFSCNAVPRLSRKEKDAVYNEWRKDIGEDYYWRYPFSWFDENGQVEEDGVWRYIGTYGDCYAFLKIGDNENSIFEPVDIPYQIRGLTRDVYYPIEADVWLYHTKREFSYAEVCGSDFDGETIKLWTLNGMDNREEWILDAQLERLTRDIEKIAKAYN